MRKAGQTYGTSPLRDVRGREVYASGKQICELKDPSKPSEDA